MIRQPAPSPDRDVLFMVSPIGTLYRSYPYIEPPYGAALVAAGLRDNGYRVTFSDLDLQLNHWQKRKPSLSRKTLSLLEDWRHLPDRLDRLPGDLQDLIRRFCEFIDPGRFRYLALSLSRLSKKTRVYDTEFGFALALAGAFRSHHPGPVIFGGQIINKIGRRSVEGAIAKALKKCVDFFFYEDGAVSLPLLLKALDRGEDFSELVAHLQNTGAQVTWWRQEGEVATLGKRRAKKYSGGDAPKPNDLLEQELLKIRPSFEISNASLYPVSVKQIFPFAEPSSWALRPICIYPYKFMYGCSHSCAFCKGAYQPLIVKPVDDVVDDLQYFVETEGVACFRFFNSQINYTPKYVERFCSEILRRNLKFHFIDSANLRKLEREVCDMLREAGCVKLWFGLESPVPKILDLIDKRLSLDQALAGVRNAHEAGIWIGMNIILGFPHETDADFRQVCDFAESHRHIVDCWNFSALQVYAETPMHDRPADYGIRLHHHHRGKMRDKGYAFSEIGGLGWKERLRRSRKRADYCQHLVGAVENQFRSNDYLVFALYQEFGSKERVKCHFDRFLEDMGRSISLAEGAKWITPNKVLGFDSSAFLEQVEAC